MFTFRQKIFLSYLAAFLLFLGAMYPFATRTVHRIAIKAMEDRATELVEKLKAAPNNEALVRRLKEEKALIFFRVSVITNEQKLLYDSHTKRLLGPRFSQEYVVDHPEVLEAFRTGIGYTEDYSDLLGQKFAYLAKAFDFHGKTYVLRTAFPHKYVSELTRDFELGASALAAVMLLLFSLITWIIINHITNPIQEITTAIHPYQEGKQKSLPNIILRSRSTEEFNQLADTLNSLSSKVQNQIDTLTFERNERAAVLESLVEGVIALDTNFITKYANPSSLRLLGLTSDEIINKPISVINLPKCEELLQKAQEEEHVSTTTLEVKTASGKKLYLDLIASPIRGGSGTILVLEDKTNHYKLMEMRKDFIANASHELKTPITIIRGFAETLHDNPDLGQEMNLSITDKIVRNCQKMNNLIKDLLAITDVENLPESRLTDCELSYIIENCMNDVQEVHQDAKIAFSIEEEANTTFIGDPHLMEVAFTNLIGNAAKYSEPPADIRIHISNEKDWLVVTIADKGLGIPEEDLEHIFQRFYRVDKARTGKIGGSGLGLSIVEMIIDKHFGKIAVQSKHDEGSTFTVRLPLQK